MSTGAYLLVRFDDKQKMVPAISALNGNDKIVNWDAIDGHYHLLIKTTTSENDLFDFVRSLDGFNEMTECVIEQDNQTVYLLDDSFTYSYLFLETANDSRESIINTFKNIDDVTFCSPTTGKFNLVAQIKSDTFDKIDRLISQQIKNLDGILRFKKDYVIFLDRI